MSEKNPELPKLSLDTALERVATILRIAEEGGNLDEAIDSSLDIARDLVADSVDRHIGLFNVLTGGGTTVRNHEGLIGMAKLNAKAWAEKANELENILERVKEKTKETMTAMDLKSIAGALGELRLSDSNPSIDYTISLRSKSVANVIDLQTFSHSDISTRFLKRVEFYAVDTEAVKKALSEGEEIPWAKLKQGKSLGVFKNVRRKPRISSDE